MSSRAKTQQVTIPQGTRIICISDIHGSLDELIRLLDKVKFCDDDLLFLLGDHFTKGQKPQETLRFLIELCKKRNVYALRGNSDMPSERLCENENQWIESLPHIIDTQNYTFVHGGLTSDNLYEQDAWACMKNDAFLEQDLRFDKWVVVGHWPVYNYCHEIPCCNPIVDEQAHIIAIDGGMGTKALVGQLNAFIIQDGVFSFETVDSFPVFIAEKKQSETGGTLNITWNDRAIRPIEKGELLSIVQHVKTDIELVMPTVAIWRDWDDSFCGCSCGTDYWLPVDIGDNLCLLGDYNDRLLCKKDGVIGWVWK